MFPNLDVRTNHFNVLAAFLKESSEIVFASPFLMEDFGSVFTAQILKRIKRITIVTTLIPNNSDQIRKVGALYSLVSAISNEEQLSILIDNKLHGKVYLFKASRGFTSGIVTSANLTGKGLNHNHEWGVQIDDRSTLENLFDGITKNADVRPIEHKHVFEMKRRADRYLLKHPHKTSDKIPLNLLEVLPTKLRSGTTNFWIKPMGWTGHRISKGDLFVDSVLKLHFSKRRPSGLGRNDVLILYAIGYKNILSIYKVDSDLMKATAKDMVRNPLYRRWPWYIIGRNMSPEFGQVWLEKNLDLWALANEFKKAYPSKHLTFVGGDTLGSLSRGQDKLHITNDFADFLITKVRNSEQN